MQEQLKLQASFAKEKQEEAIAREQEEAKKAEEAAKTEKERQEKEKKKREALETQKLEKQTALEQLEAKYRHLEADLACRNKELEVCTAELTATKENLERTEARATA